VSLTVAFVISPDSSVRAERIRPKKDPLLLFFFFHFPFVFSKDHSLLILPLSLSSRSSRERRPIINDMRHTGSRNIKYSRAFMTAPVRKRGPDRWAPRNLVGEKESRRRQRKKGRACEGSGCSSPSPPPPRRRIYRGEIRRFIEAVRGS